MTPLVIGVTSHRNIPACEIEPIRQRVRDLFAQLQRGFPHAPLMVLSALAEGGDQLVAEEALIAGARVIAPLPLPRAMYAQDFSDSGRAAFDDLCGRVEVLQLPLLPGSTPADVAARGDARNRQYAQAGTFIAGHCHILLALWDGRESNLLGGTAQVVRYHLDGIMPGLIERRRVRHTVLDSSDESLVYHIICSRSDTGGSMQPPLPPLQPLQARWLADDGAHDADAGMPDGFRRLFEQMQQFNVDAQQHAGDDRADAAQAGHVGTDAQIARLFDAADRLALHFQTRVLLAMRGLFTLAALMGIAFICYSDLPTDLPYQDKAIYVFVLLFGAGVWLAWLARRREWHRKYIDYRALAEGLRVQRYWQRAGIEAAASGSFAHDNFMQKQDIELGWIRNVMRAAGLHVAVDAAQPDDLDRVIDAWIGAPDGDGQLGYYARKAEQRSRTHHRTQRFARVLLIVVMSLSVFLAIFHRWLSADLTTMLVAAMGVLAIVAAARESYAYRKADKELIKQYRYMRGIFANARRKLDADPDPGGRRDILRSLGEACLAEHAEWALMHRERPLEHGKL